VSRAREKSLPASRAIQARFRIGPAHQSFCPFEPLLRDVTLWSHSDRQLERAAEAPTLMADVADADSHLRINRRIVRNTVAVNYLGLCARCRSDAIAPGCRSDFS